MAGGPAPGRDFSKGRPLDAAAIGGMRAARMEVAAARRVERRGDLPLHRMVAALAQVETRHFGQQCRSEEHTSELQSLMRISYAVFCLKKNKRAHYTHT